MLHNDKQVLVELGEAALRQGAWDYSVDYIGSSAWELTVRGASSAVVRHAPPMTAEEIREIRRGAPGGAAIAAATKPGWKTPDQVELLRRLGEPHPVAVMPRRPGRGRGRIVYETSLE